MYCKFGKSIVLLLVLVWAVKDGFAQTQTSRFGNIWYFGEVGLDFNCNPPRVLRGESKITPWVVGSSTLSDECGDLRFYCNGDTIWDFAHNFIVGPAIPLNGSRQSTQSSVILPHPQDPKKFFFFTVDGDEVNNFNGLSYTELEIGGNPIFPVSNQVLVRGTNEMVTACSDGNGGYWVVTKLKGKDEFRSYHVTNTGVDTSAVRSTAGGTASESGQLKFSPDGRFLAITRPLQLFKFDIATGAVKNFSLSLGVSSSGFPWLDDGTGIEFSPSGSFLYTNNFNGGVTPGEEGVYQFDLRSDDEMIIRATPLRISPPSTVLKGGFQVGPDGKIYIIEGASVDKLSIIHRPEYLGTDADFEYRFINLRLTSPGTYFPNFNQSWFFEPALFFVNGGCNKDTTYLELNDKLWYSLTDSNDIDSVRWTIDDPVAGTQVKSGFKVPHYYDQFGCFNVTIEAFSHKLGGSVIRRRLARISQMPTTELGPRDTTLCVNPKQLFRTVATFDNPFSEYTWYYKTFADVAAGIPDLGLNPISSGPDITPKVEGRFWVVKTFKCCTNSDTIDIHHDSIIPFFKVNDGLQCERNNSYEFTNLSTPTFKNTSWKFGDATSDTGKIVTKKYNAIGSYYVEMAAESQFGCKTKITRIMLVVKHPVAKFSIDTNQLCFKGNVFKFKDSSTIEFGNGSIQKWTFDLGDSTTTGQKQFTKSYTKPGTYTVMLAINSSQDCKDTAYKQVKVFSQPVAGFAIDDTSQCRLGNVFTFTDTSSSSIDSINYRWWTYGDATPPANRTGMPLQHNRSFNTVDSFRIKLKIGAGLNCYDSMTRYVHVHGDPFVDFSIPTPTQCLDGNRYDFDDTTFVEKGTIQTYLWDFGDSSPISNTGIGKSYAKYGSYNVKLKVISNKGCTDSVSKAVLLHPMPEAAFTVNPTISCFKNHSFSFSGAASFVPVGAITGYLWDFDDATTSTFQNPPAKVYAKDTAHEVKLIITSDKNCVDTAKQTVDFYPTPVAVIKVDNLIQCLEENVFYYKGDSSAAGNGTITEYLWNLGDGTIEDVPNPAGKFYIKADTFDVNLKVTTADGCTDTASVQVQVRPSPVANFSVAPACLFHNSVFKDLSTSNPGNIISWSWNLGDGTLTTDTNPVHTYDNTGAYTVTLSVESNYGCRASVTKINEAVVKGLPQAKFGMAKIDYDDKNTTVQFIDSSIDVSFWDWDFGNGIISSQQNPLIVFDDTVSLPVRFIVSNAEGCFDTVYRNVFIAPDFYFHVPSAFTPNKDELNRTFGGEGTRYYKEYYLRIYNRWGQQVFESNNSQERWDGTSNGEACPVGLYTYVYRLLDVFGQYHNYNGSLMLIR